MRWTALALLAATNLPLPCPAHADVFTPCADNNLPEGAECGHVTVFEDRAAAKGRQLELEVIVLRATGKESAEPLFLLAGGPGQGATDLAVLGRPFARVRETRDIVLVDQRGTGDSNPLVCASDVADNPAAAFGALWSPEEIERCFQRASTHADPGLYTTDHVVDDLEEVRRRLGYERVVLWGGSGGTRTALVWMRRHPESVLAVAIDGVAPTDFRAPSGYARACQDSLDKVLADCAAQKSCAEAYPNLADDFAKVLALFDDGPVETRVTPPEGGPVPVEMHRGDFVYAVRGLLYSSRRIPDLPDWIHHTAATGDVSAFAQAHWQRSAAIFPILAVGVHLSVYCAEDVPFLGDLDLEALTDDTFIGDYAIEQYRAACEAWSIDPIDRAYLDPVRSEIPVLVLSGYYDPSTPVATADAVASHLPNSRHLVVRNEAHGSGFGCARETLLDFLVSGSLEGLGPACKDVGAIQFNVGG